MQNNIQILSTKKLQTNQRQFLLNADIAVLEANFIETNAIDFQIQTIHENLIFTSQNAVRSILASKDFKILQTKNIFCVGIKTKELLEEQGFNVIAHTDYASDLAEIITLIYKTAKYTFFCGNLRRETLPQALTNAGIIFNEVRVYETTLTPQKINTPLNGILFFSPSGVESYLKENNIYKEICFCIGETTAETLEDITENIIIANQPTVENTIIQCINFYK